MPEFCRSDRDGRMLTVTIDRPVALAMGANLFPIGNGDGGR